MAIPNGSGSEVLRNAAIDSNGAGATAKVDFGGTTGTGSIRSSGNTAGVVAVPANVIITVLNVICTAHGAQTAVAGTIDWQGGGTDISIFKQYGMSADTTFVFNDRFVLREGDALKFYNNASSCDYSVNFIYQDWT
jgi:hypothetical protein